MAGQSRAGAIHRVRFDVAAVALAGFDGVEEASGGAGQAGRARRGSASLAGDVTIVANSIGLVLAGRAACPGGNQQDRD